MYNQFIHLTSDNHWVGILTANGLSTFGSPNGLSSKPDIFLSVVKKYIFSRENFYTFFFLSVFPSFLSCVTKEQSRCYFDNNVYTYIVVGRRLTVSWSRRQLTPQAPDQGHIKHNHQLLRYELYKLEDNSCFLGRVYTYLHLSRFIRHAFQHAFILTK